MARVRWSPLLYAVALALPVAAADRPLPRPTLTIETVDGTSRVWVETEGPLGPGPRRMLHETKGAVRPVAAGRDPAGRTTFALWEETGAESWSAYSRDGGATWSRAQKVQTALRLRDGAVRPGQPMPEPPADLALPASARLFLVQFRATGLPEWRQTLTDAGAEVLNPFPDNGHIVRMDPGTARLVASFDFVARVEPYHPWYRLEPGLRDWLGVNAGLPDRLRVRAVALDWGPEGKARIAAAAAAAGGRIVSSPPNGQIVDLDLDRSALRRIAAHDDVMWIDRWTPPSTDMDRVREDDGANWLEAGFGYCGQGVRGEVLDAGIQPDHPDFDGVVFHGSHDVDSHGTSTYGIVFGNGARDGDGDAKGTGNLPCSLGQGIFADYGFLTDRFAHTQELKQAPYFASFQTNSWGDSQTTLYNSASFEMDDIIWRLDIAITQSQSNTGDRSSRPQAWAKNIISVGGIYHYDTLDPADDCWCGGASIGPAEDGRIKPDVSYWYDSIYTTTTGSGYTSGFGGTSAATPETAGVLGLLVQMWADNVWGTDPVGGTVFEKQPHASTIKALLVNNAQPYPFSGSAADLSRFKQGWGRASARVAKERAARSFVVDQTERLRLGDVATYDVDVPTGESELKITMIYPDPPGTISSTLHRINDLNLRVTSPGGSVYHGNHGLADGNESLPGGSPNGVDTVENVFVRNPEAGLWTVEIQAAEINQDAALDTPESDATFALVVTGATGRVGTPAGTVRFNRATYGCGQDARIQVSDGNAGAPTVAVEVRSGAEPAPETVVLEETPPLSGKFVGTLTVTSAPPSSGDGRISAADGDTLTVRYLDADDGQGGANVERLDTAATDCRAPAISSVATAEVTGNSARIVWTTDEISGSTVAWGETVPPGQTTNGNSSTLQHVVSLTNLAPCTVYWYEVRSADLYSNLAVDDNGGRYFHFETLGDFGSGLQACHAGRISLDRSVADCADAVPVRLVDLDLNLSTSAVDTAAVTVTSSSERSPETLLLTETAANSSVFVGSLPTGVGPAATDGVLQVQHGDAVTATYRDADDGSGATAVSFATGTVDCLGPDTGDIRVTDLTDESAVVRWTTSEPARGRVDWGTTPSLPNTVAETSDSTSHAVSLGPLAECGRIYFRVISTDVHGNVSTRDAGGSPFEFNAHQIPGALFKDGFETATGWTLQGEWQVGAPQGRGTSPGDPTAAFAGTGVLGHDLTGLGAKPGDYEPQKTEKATSPVIDASALVQGQLKFRRWLNVGGGAISSIEVKRGNQWYQIWTSDSLSGVTESAWSLQTVSLQGWGDGNASLQIGFKQNGGFLPSANRAGWNIDRLIVRSGNLPDFDACGTCGGSPTFSGAAAATDPDPCADGGIVVSWQPAPAWGTGRGGSYAIYRSTDPSFVPAPSNLLASGISGTSFSDSGAPNGVALYYVVRAENDEACSSGPSNGGVTDGNLVRARATDEISQILPGPVSSLTASGINLAHVRLEWSGATNAARYHVEWAASPVGPWSRIADVTTLSYEDRDRMGDPENAYYRVVAADPCGNEGP